MDMLLVIRNTRLISSYQLCVFPPFFSRRNTRNCNRCAFYLSASGERKYFIGVWVRNVQSNMDNVSSSGFHISRPHKKRRSKKNEIQTHCFDGSTSHKKRRTVGVRASVTDTYPSDKQASRFTLDSSIFDEH